MAPLTTVDPARTVKPRWQRGRLFQFFASLKLAVVLLSVLIVAAIFGTIYESSFDAKIARAYIYGASWFNLWLVLLGANLAVSALSRWPWKKHHVAFLVTHLGIITLLLGSLIGRIWGIEGTVTLFRGDPPANRLVVDERQLRVHDSDGIVKGYPAEFLHRPPRPDRPRDLGPLANGAHLSMVDHADAIEARLNPRPVNDGGAPAVHFTIQTSMMGQNLEGWLLADDAQHARFSMGLAQIELKRGNGPSGGSASSGETDIEESIFAFSNAPDQQVANARKGGSSGAQVRLEPPGGDGRNSKGRVTISLGGRDFGFDVAENIGHELMLPETKFNLKIENFWPDFRIDGGKPRSISDQPNNPAVLITLRGRGVPVAGNAPDHRGQGRDFETNGGPPAMPAAGETAPNKLTLFVSADNSLRYELVSRKNGASTGSIGIDQPIATGWADWQFKIDKIMAQAEPWMDFKPAAGDVAKDLPDGIRIRVEQNGRTVEQWVPSGWQISVPAAPNGIQVAYGYRQLALPIALELLDFEVKRNEGTDTPAGFKSTLRVSSAEGEVATGQCWMNHPFSFPGEWWRTWTGLTYKISQASWNPENLDQSTVQILRDPGWMFKWIGSLLIVAGVFMMFYLRPYRKQTAGQPIRLITPRAFTPEPQAATVERNEPVRI